MTTILITASDNCGTNLPNLVDVAVITNGYVIVRLKYTRPVDVGHRLEAATPETFEEIYEVRNLTPHEVDLPWPSAEYDDMDDFLYAGEEALQYA